MKLGVLFSGGKDSCYATYSAKKQGHEISCLISIFSENPESYMFHTPSISQVEAQAKVMNLPLIIQKTKGKKEAELLDLEKAIEKAIKTYKIEGIVTGAIASNYQESRIGKICKKLKISCLNLLWGKDELEYLNELIENRFKVIVTGVFAYPLTKDWLGKEINGKFIEEAIDLNNKYKIHIAGEGGEFETLVVNCPLFKHELKIKSKKISGEKNSWRMEVKLS